MSMFGQQDLQALVKGIRGAADATSYISKAIQDIKDELKNRDVKVKTQALRKLTYLQMLGHDMNWASFHIIEVMSQERFGMKRVGFLAASQSFHAKTDVIVLCTQLLKKELTSSHSPYNIGLAINTLSNIATEELAHDLIGDIVTMLTSSRAYIRKRATLVLYKLYLQYPQGLRLTFDHLKRRLTDDNPAVVSCAVNVICELARKKPSNYVSLAPELFAILTNSTNNWMLIKVTKLMSALLAEEPRLARKLLEPLAHIVQTNSAKSLMYECISTMTVALQYTKKADGTDAKNVPAVVRLCTDRLRELVRDPDQNLKYLGLVGLVQLMKSHPRVVAEHRELVLQCLTDGDVTIRLRALELICGMVTRRNLVDIVNSLFQHIEMAEGHYRDVLIEKIIFICSRDKYAYLSDFAWYVSVLSRLAFLENTSHNATIATQLLEVAVRVEEVRPAVVQSLLPMLADPVLFKNAKTAPPTVISEEESVIPAVFTSSRVAGGQVLYAAAWAVGEYVSIIPPQMYSAVLDALLHPTVASLPPAVQAVYIQCVLKVLSASATHAYKVSQTSATAATGALNAFLAMAASVLERLQPFASSADVDVQERACIIQQLMSTLGVPFTRPATPTTTAEATKAAEAELLAMLGDDDEAKDSKREEKKKDVRISIPPPLPADLRIISTLLASLFSEPLKPVNPKAQKKVAVPAGLDLDTPINPKEFKEMEKEDKKDGFVYNSISFEDSYGVGDEEFAGKKGKKGKKSGAMSSRYNFVEDDDEEDSAWFSNLEKENKARDRMLWGGDSDSDDGKKKKKKKGKKDDDEKKKKKKTSDDPYMLASKKKSAYDSDSDSSVDNIPIVKLETGALKSSLNVSIFGDFAKSSKDKKKSKKSKKDDSDEDEKPKFRVISDDEMPSGAEDDDEKVNEVVDALASIDLRSPLGAGETLPTRQHRSVDDPAAVRNAGKTKSKGRARVLGAGADAYEAPVAPAKGKDKEEKKSKKDKDGKDEKKSKKDKESKDKDVKKSKKEEKVGPEALLLSTDLVHFLPLASDKLVKFTFAIVPLSTAENAAALVVRTFALSSKKTLASVTLNVTAGVEGVEIASKAVLAKTLEPREKEEKEKEGKKKAKKEQPPSKETIIPFTYNANIAYPTPQSIVAALPALGLTLSYAVGDDSTVLEARAPFLHSAILRPVQLPMLAYQELVKTEGASFQATTAQLQPLAKGGLEGSLKLARRLLRCASVAATDSFEILYAKTSGGQHFAALAKIDANKGVVDLNVRSPVAELAAAVVTEIQAIFYAENQQ